MLNFRYQTNDSSSHSHLFDDIGLFHQKSVVHNSSMRFNEMNLILYFDKLNCHTPWIKYRYTNSIRHVGKY